MWKPKNGSVSSSASARTTTLLAQDKPDQALPYVKAAANAGAFRKRATTLLANLARLRGDTDAATAHEAEANRMPEDEVPPDPFVWDYMTLQVGRKDAFGRIGELEKANRIQETIPLLLDMTRKYPEAKTYFNLGVNLSALGDYRAAIGHFETTILLDPAHAKAHNSLFHSQSSPIRSRNRRNPSISGARLWSSIVRSN
jgi:tetratricopeptide (TPR) repeat protein